MTYLAFFQEIKSTCSQKIVMPNNASSQLSNKQDLLDNISGNVEMKLWKAEQN